MRSSINSLKLLRISTASAFALGAACMLSGCGAAMSSTATGTSLGSSASADSTSTSSSLSSDSTAGNLQIMASADSSPSDPTDLTLGVSSIDLHLQNGAFVNVYSQATSLDLSSLLNGTLSTITQSTIAAGTYDQIRITFASASETLPDGNTLSIDYSATSTATPSQNIFVIPLDTPVAITAGTVSHLLVDFRSARMAPLPPADPGDCGMIPPIRLANLDTAGSVSGSVTTTANSVATDLSGVFVVASIHGKVVGTSVSDGSGNFEIIGLVAGSYDISVMQKGYQPKMFSQVAIAAAANTSQDADLTVANSPPAGPPFQGNPPPPWN